MSDLQSDESGGGSRQQHRQIFMSEWIATAGLVLVVVGSGIMAESLAQGNAAMALLANSIATGAGLYALIQVFGSISGAHLNPLVSAVEWSKKQITGWTFYIYLFAQIIGALVGVGLAHLIFDLSLLQVSSHDRLTVGTFVSEIVATFGLILVILVSTRNPKATVSTSIASIVACYITSAYWFTSSTSFANPAVTLARVFTNTFTGIAPSSAAAFAVAQFMGAALALRVFRLLVPVPNRSP